MTAVLAFRKPHFCFSKSPSHRLCQTYVSFWMKRCLLNIYGGMIRSRRYDVKQGTKKIIMMVVIGPVSKATDPKEFGKCVF